MLQPFLAVVRSGDTTGPITAIALSSIDKFLTYSLVHADSPSLALAMAQVSGAGTHCRFEASDSVSDEVVLLKILDVLRNALTGPVGHVLTDEAVCEMMETGLSMCCQMRLSGPSPSSRHASEAHIPRAAEMLRRSAERTMQAMVAAIFHRLCSLPASVDASYVPPEDDSGDDDDRRDGLRMNAPDPRSASIPAASASSDLARDKTAPSPFEGMPTVDGESAAEKELEAPRSELDSGVQGPVDEDVMLDLLPYGLPSIKELLRVLVSLLNPFDTQHTDSMRLTSLGILNTAFEIAGESIGRFPSLRAMVSDDLCKHLFQLIRGDNTIILATALRCMTNVLDTMRRHLKMQLELFLSYLMDRLRPQSPAGLGKLSQSTSGHGSVDVEADLDALTWNRPSSEGLNPPARTGSPAPGTSRSQAMAPRLGVVATGETRQLMLEHLAHFVRAPDFLVNLWVNFDCSVDCEDLFERVTRFLSRVRSSLRRVRDRER